MPGILYLVGTPIGNLGDFSPRAAQTLQTVDFIAAEDTRVTVKLLNSFNIKKPMICYFEHNRSRRGEEILSRLEGGESCALVTDAGMPAISDPGADLVALCAANGISVAVVPGPCAAVSALALSGLDTSRFCFEGFLDANKKSRVDRLTAIKYEKRTIIFYEAPHKLRTTLRDMLSALGDRRMALAREMTKLHEEVIRTTLSAAVDFYELNEPRGEFVLVVEGNPSAAPENCGAERKTSCENPDELVARYMAEGMTRPEAVKQAASETGVRRCDLYKRTATRHPN